MASEEYPEPKEITIEIESTVYSCPKCGELFESEVKAVHHIDVHCGKADSNG